MPGFVKTAADEKKWSRSKKAAGKKGSETNWALSNYIFHRMGKVGKCIVDPELVKSGQYEIVKTSFVNKPQLGERHITTSTGTVVRKKRDEHGDKVVDVWFSPEDVDKRLDRRRTAEQYPYPPNNLGSPRDNQETIKPFEDEGKGVWIDFRKGLVKISSNLLQAANAAWGHEDGEEGERRNDDVGNEVKDMQRKQKIDPPGHVKQDLRKRPESRDSLYPSDVAGSDSITWGSFKIASKNTVIIKCKDVGDVYDPTDSEKRKIILKENVKKEDEKFGLNQNLIQGGVKVYGPKNKMEKSEPVKPPSSPVSRTTPLSPEEHQAEADKLLGGKVSYRGFQEGYGKISGFHSFDQTPGVGNFGVRDGESLSEAYARAQNRFKLKSNRSNPIKGGKGDDLEYDEVDRKQLKEGIDVEQEHVRRDKTKTWEEKKKFAADIAMDHLEEDPEYYTKLKKMEDKPYEKGIRFINNKGKEVILRIK